MPRVLPHNLDAEAAVLGGVILRNETLTQLDSLETDDFYSMQHKVVWQAIRNLEARSKPIDVVTLEAEIETQGKLDAIGGVSFLGELAARVPTADNVVAYAEIVQEKRQARRIILAASDIVERGYADGLDVAEFVSESVAAITSIDRPKVKRARTAHEVVGQRVKELEDVAQRKAAGEDVRTGIPSGVAKLDEKTGGYPIGDFVLICARPAMGKTAMAMSAVAAATAAGMGAHVFAAEGGWRMYADRLISKGSGIPVQRVRSASFTTADVGHLAKAMVAFRDRKWLLDDEAGLTPLEIVRRVRKERKRLGTRLVAIDYLTILKRAKPNMTEHEALDDACTTFARAAIDDDITYVGLAQLNRKVEERDDKRPIMSDLRGSGALEERPRLIVSPYRGAEYYKSPREGIDYECTCLASKHGACVCRPTDDAFEKLVKVLVLKNSNGQTGHVDATWHGPTTEIY